MKLAYTKNLFSRNKGYDFGTEFITDNLETDDISEFLDVFYTGNFYFKNKEWYTFEGFSRASGKLLYGNPIKKWVGDDVKFYYL